MSCIDGGALNGILHYLLDRIVIDSLDEAGPLVNDILLSSLLSMIRPYAVICFAELLF